MWDNEARRIRPFCRGGGVDVGSGDRPVINPDRVVTIDKDPARVAHFHLDGRELPFKDQTLDFVASIHSIEHIDDTVAVLKEWVRVLKVGGYLCLVVPDKNFVPNMGQPGSDPTHCHDFSPEEFRAMVASLGNLEIVQFNTIHDRWSFDLVARKVRHEPA